MSARISRRRRLADEAVRAPMKRAGKLIAAVADLDNLRLAFWKAAKGKRGKPDCMTFQNELDRRLEEMRDSILGEGIRVGDYHYFKVNDPKQRMICAASFRERVLHHALMNVCEPVLEKAAVFDSYACGKGKGRLAAVERAQGFARKHGWFLKMDVRRTTGTIILGSVRSWPQLNRDVGERRD